MRSKRSVSGARVVAERLRYVGIAWALLALGMVAFAWAFPVDANVQNRSSGRRKELEPLPAVGADVRPLLAKMAGTRLIRAAQVQAAVKDTGAADRLAKRLSLEGIADIAGTHVAYIRVEKKGVQSVKQGDTVLDFVVEKIVSNRVTLSLQGVQVVLNQ